MSSLKILAPIRRWWWLIVVTTILTTVTAFMLVQQAPNTYRASATLLVGQALEDSEQTTGDVAVGRQLAVSYVEIARRDLVGAAVRDAVGLNAIPEYRVSVLPNTQLIEIIAIDPVPARAQQIAQAVAEQLRLRSPDATAASDIDTKFIDLQLTSLRAEIEKSTEMLLEQPVGEARTDALENLAMLQNSYTQLLDANRTDSTNVLSILEPAQLPSKPVPTNYGLVAAAALVGIALATGAAYLIELVDTRIRSVETVRELSGLPILAEVVMHDEQDSVVAYEQPRSPSAEAFRYLRTSVQFATVDAARRLLLVVSSVSGEGKSTVSSNLAVVLAQAGHRVLLIDCDLRRPQIGRRFQLRNTLGLTGLMLDYETLTTERISEFVQTTHARGLDVLVAGTPPPNPSELLSSQKMTTLLELASDMYDYVVIDSSPVLLVPDALILAPQVTTVLPVVSFGMTKQPDIQSALERIRETGAAISGISVNRVPVQQSGYGYGYGDMSDASEKASLQERDMLYPSRQVPSTANRKARH